VPQLRNVTLDDIHLGMYERVKAERQIYRHVSNHAERAPRAKTEENREGARGGPFTAN
jgi:hypothetical protein